MKLFTIGFTKKSAEQFFTALTNSGTTRVIDVRLHNVSQLAGFAKRQDLEYFLDAIGGIEYSHSLELAPTAEMLDDYRKRDGDWDRYESRFVELLKYREVESALDRELISNATLLCSERAPERCHRLLVAEYLREAWGDLEIVHL